MAEAEKWLFNARRAEVSPSVSLSYISTFEKGSSSRNSASDSKKTILLVHGYPQTLYSMRHVYRLLVDAGLNVVAADYRGAGGSSMPVGGYDKWTMGEDLHKLMTEHLGAQQYSVLGHDIGSMVATAMALRYREAVKALIVMECPQPGTFAYKDSITNLEFTYGPCFHFFFHNARDLPEQLTYGREDIYLDHFFDRLALHPHFLTDKERTVYHNAFRKSGRMRAGFEVYRAFTQDDADVRKSVKEQGKIEVPVLATGGEKSKFTETIQPAAREYASDVSYVAIPDASHWVPEENAEGLVKEVLAFLRQ
ncbi:unnamed protein product [Jaminaea pallidilutea]